MSEEHAAKVRLNSWKDIASYIGRDVRTVIRWEKKGLPVRRVPGGQRQAVFAYKHELDGWLENGNNSRIAIAEAPSDPVPEYPESETEHRETRAEATVPTPAPAAPHNKYLPSLLKQRAQQLILLATVFFIISAAIVWLVRLQAATIVRPLHFVQLTDDGKTKLNLRTDGTTLYFNEFEVYRSILMSVPIAGGPIQRIDTPFSNVELQDISSDGTKALVLSYEGTEEERLLWLVPTHGGPAHRIGEATCRFARWSPDNRIIACVSGTGIIVFNSDGSNPRNVGSFPSRPINLIWSPDGERLRFVLYGPPNRSISAWELTVGKKNNPVVSPALKLPLPENCCLDWAWTADGTRFAYLRYDSNRRFTLALTSDAKWLHPWLPQETEVPVKVGIVSGIAPAKSQNTLYLLITNPDRGELLKFDSQQQTFRTLLPVLSARYLSFSRDGQWMTYTSTLDDSLWRSRTDGSNALKLSDGSMSVELSSWSPDGHRIAFMGKKPGRPWRLFLIGRDGGVAEEASSGDDGQGAPSWSPDGRHIVYGNVECSEVQACWIRRLDLATRQTEKLPASYGLRTARWSSNGKYIAALHSETHELMLFDLQTRRWQSLAGRIMGDDLSWSSDSQFLYADSPQGEKPVIERIRISDGHRESIVNLAMLQNISGRMDFWFGLTPDNSPIVLRTFAAAEVYTLDWTD